MMIGSPLEDRRRLPVADAPCRLLDVASGLGLRVLAQTAPRLAGTPMPACPGRAAEANAEW